MNCVFLDTSYAVALANNDDPWHENAAAWSDLILHHYDRMLTTAAIILEIGDAFSRQRLRASGTSLLHSMQNDPYLDVIPLEDDCLSKAIHLYTSRPDKEWGLTDCVSFVVMQERGITDALTADRHFQQAGFRALLLES